MSDLGLTVTLMGPLEVRRNGAPVRLTVGRLRTLLAALALSAGKTVSTERLALALWGESLPANARRTVQTYVTRLRRTLGPDAIRTMPDGYKLDANPDRIDVLRFRRLLAEASRGRGTAAERALVEEALALWRGSPFQDVDSDWLRESVSAYLLESRLSAVERRIDLDLADGRHGPQVAELMELAASHPLRESLWERLIVALGRSGRQAEALATYEQIRRHLADELGTDPSAELCRIHASLLQAETPPNPGHAPQGVTRRAEAAGGPLVWGSGSFSRGVCVLLGTADGNQSFLALIWTFSSEGAEGVKPT